MEGGTLTDKLPPTRRTTFIARVRPTPARSVSRFILSDMTAGVCLPGVQWTATAVKMLRGGCTRLHAVALSLSPCSAAAADGDSDDDGGAGTGQL